MIIRICIALALIVFAILIANGVDPQTAVIRSTVVGFGSILLSYFAILMFNVVTQQSTSSTEESQSNQTQTSQQSS